MHSLRDKDNAPAPVAEVFKFRLYYLHSPFSHLVTPARPATQGLEYVFPSQPQTGSYSMVQGPSDILDLSMHSSLLAFFLQVPWLKASMIKAAVSRVKNFCFMF
jgi:hypothetical protein